MHISVYFPTDMGKGFAKAHKGSFMMPKWRGGFKGLCKTPIKRGLHKAPIQEELHEVPRCIEELCKVPKQRGLCTQINMHILSLLLLIGQIHEAPIEVALQSTEGFHKDHRGFDTKAAWRDFLPICMHILVFVSEIGCSTESLGDL